MSNLPTVFWSGPVQSEWTDYNGHLRDAFYLLIISFAGDELMAQIGLGPEGREQLGHSMFTLESHVQYLREVKVDQVVEVRGQIIAHDAKRLHLNFSLHLQGEQPPLATAEQLWLNVDMSGPKATPLAPTVASAVALMAEADHALETQGSIGRRIGLPAPKPSA